MKVKTKESNVKSYYIRWLLPSCLMMLLVFTLLSQFSSDEREQITKKVHENLYIRAQQSADILSEYVKNIKVSANTIACFLSEDPTERADYSLALKSIMEETGIYDAVVSSVNGDSFFCSGITREMWKTDYFQKLVKEKKDIIYTTNDGITGRHALVIATRIPAPSEKYILCFFDMKRFSTVLQKEDFGTNIFYAIVEKEGRVIATDGCSSSLCVQTDNYYDFLSEEEMNKKSILTLKSKLAIHEPAVGYFMKDNEEKTLMFCPLTGNDYYLVIGMDTGFVYGEINKMTSSYTIMSKKIMLTLIFFLLSIVVISITTKTSEMKKNKMLKGIADTDILTDLYNKAATEREIKRYLSNHPNEKGLLLVMDIDNFKKINDTLGHAFGDDVLHNFGIQLKAQFRVTDVVGRTGGDEFTIYIPNIPDEESAQNLAEKIEQLFKTFQAGEYVKYYATASIGAAVYPIDGDDFESLYKAADRALYTAKKRGKNQLAFYQDI